MLRQEVLSELKAESEVNYVGRIFTVWGEISGVSLIILECNIILGILQLNLVRSWQEKGDLENGIYLN